MTEEDKKQFLSLVRVVIENVKNEYPFREIDSELERGRIRFICDRIRSETERIVMGWTGILAKPVEELGLSTRARRCLRKHSISLVGQLTERTEHELRTENFGKTSLYEVKSKLAKLGLKLREIGGG